MATVKKDDVTLGYSQAGSGFPVLMIAPGGMRSARPMWSNAPWDIQASLAENFQTIAMDQRNAGESSAPLSAEDDWDTYAHDQLALMDSLGCEKFHVIGMCIGGPYILNLMRLAPDRIQAAVIWQSIGRDGNRDEFLAMFDGWAQTLLDQTRAGDQPDTQSALAAQRKSMFENDEVFFCLPEEQIKTLTTPSLLLQGNDVFHPKLASTRLAELLPNNELIESWRDGPDMNAARQKIVQFLLQQTPA